MCLCIPHKTPFEQTAPSELRSVRPAQLILLVLFFPIQIATSAWKTQLRSTIALPLGFQKILTLRSLIRFVCAMNKFIVSHTHWQGASALDAVFLSHYFGLLHLKYVSVNGIELLSNRSRPSCLPLKFSTLRNLPLLFRNSQKED